MTLSGRKLITTTDGGERTERDLEPDETASTGPGFGLSLDHVPEPLHPRTER